MIAPKHEDVFKLPGSDSPLKSNLFFIVESTSVTAIMQGGGDVQPNNLYYVDCN